MRFEILPAIDSGLYEEASRLAGFGLYHGPRWHRFMTRALGWQVSAVVARDDGGRLLWYLPFVSKMRLGLRRQNVALPLSHRCGPAIADDSEHSGPEAGTRLARLLPNLEVHDDCAALGLTRYTVNTATTLDLTDYSSADALLKQLDYKSVRYPVNRARREGVKVIEAENDKHFLDLYRLTVETRHRQGAPVYPRRFFEELRSAYADSGQLSVLLGYRGSQPLSAVVFLYTGDEALYAYSASTCDVELKRLGANDLVMWRAIEQSLQRGCRLLDFGSSPHYLPGLRSYKEKWGGRSETLWYSRIGAEHGTVDRESSLARAGTAVFQRLPLPLFRALTPPVFRLVI